MNGPCGWVLGIVLVATAAQAEFTELTPSDPALNSSPDNDFWITSAAAADADADGDLDLLVAGFFVVHERPGRPRVVEDRLTLYRNDGPGGGDVWRLTALALEAGGLALGASDLAWGDADADGDEDAAVGSVGALALYRNDGGALAPTAAVLPAYWEDADPAVLDLSSLAWGDFDGDGWADLAVPSVMVDFAYAPLQLLRNDRAGGFADAGAGLPVTTSAAARWVDRDRDGDLDLLVANASPWAATLVNLYRNDGFAFALADSGLAHLAAGTADWCDADADGGRDVVVAGMLADGTPAVRVLRDDGEGGWDVQDVGEDDGWLAVSGLTCADVDGDGRTDLVVGGAAAAGGRTLAYANEGGTFVAQDAALPAPEAGGVSGAQVWFDLDGDGDLDVFMAGGYLGEDGVTVEARTQFFRNDAASNAPPGAPGDLAATVEPGVVTLAWSPAADDTAPAVALTYDLELVCEGVPAAAEAALPAPGNVGGNLSWTLRGLPHGTYGWSVRALDAAFAAGPKAIGAFTVGTTAVTPPPAGRGAVALGPVQPNPQRRDGAPARCALVMSRAAAVAVDVFDVRGRRVARLHDGPLDAGTHALDLGGAGLPSGTYVVRARAGGEVASRRWTVVR